MSSNFNTPDYRLTAGFGRKVKIVNHHSALLNNKCGFIIGKDIPSYYNWKLWLEHENITVVVHQSNVVPADENAISFADAFAIHWKIAVHNIAVKIHSGLRR